MKFRKYLWQRMHVSNRLSPRLFIRVRNRIVAISMFVGALFACLLLYRDEDDENGDKRSHVSEADAEIDVNN